MTQSERREYLIQYLLKEDKKIFRPKMPSDKQGQEELLRSLMNVRMPKPISEEFLKIQDEYLTQRNMERGITDVNDLQPTASDPRFYIWQGDITTLKCDAIVNACNSQMLGCFSPMHACIDNFKRRLHQDIICRRNTFFIQLALSYSGRPANRMKICWPAVIKNA